MNRSLRSPGMPAALLALVTFASTTVCAQPAPSTRALPGAPPASMRLLPPRPLIVGVVQLNAFNRLVKMFMGEARGQDADAIAGMLELLKDQIAGPLSFAVYADAMGKPDSVIAAGHLRQAALTRELLNGAAMVGGPEAARPQKIPYRGETIMVITLPQAAGAVPSAIPLKPAFSITGHDDLLVSTSVDRIKSAFDAATTSGAGLAARPDVARMMREYPPDADVDVWLFVPKPTGPLTLPGLPGGPANGGSGPRTPGWLSGIDPASQAFGPLVAQLRFTPAGVRFTGLAAIDRTALGRPKSDPR